MNIRERAAVKARRVREVFAESKRNRELVREARHAPRPDLEAAYQRHLAARGEVAEQQAREWFAGSWREADREERTRFARIPSLERAGRTGR